MILMKNRKYLIILFIILSFCLIGCTKTIGYVDKTKKKTLEEVKEYTINELRKKYNIEVDIIKVEVQDIWFCNGSIDGSCLSKRVIKDAKKYIMKCKASNGIEFEVVYNDAYINKENAKEYNDIVFKDTYEDNYEGFKLNEDILYNIKRIMSENNIEGLVYKPFESETHHDFTILINIQDIGKIKKFTSELNDFIPKTYKKDNYISYFLFIGDDDLLDSIKETNALDVYDSIKKYEFKTLYTSGKIVTVSEYNKYIQDKKYNKYLVKIHYVYNKSENEISSYIYGVENNNSVQ